MKVKLRSAVKEPFERVYISGEFIRLDALLKYSAIAQSGGEAKFYILEGQVTVNNEVCTQRGKKIHQGDTVHWQKTMLKIYSKAQKPNDES